jgi:histidyl-tRNA synthetase
MQVVQQLGNLGLTDDASGRLLDVMRCQNLSDLSAALGADCAPVRDLKLLFELAAGYGYGDWLQYDASVVRGLAYYTGESLLNFSGQVFACLHISPQTWHLRA